MSLLIADQWREFQLLEAGDGMKQERWGNVVLARPDPQIIWPWRGARSWKQSDGIYHRSAQGGGHWEFRKTLPSAWNIRYRNLVFKIHPTGFKHVGLFPEQAVNWDWLNKKITARLNAGATGKHKPGSLALLNLFGYTGGATIAAAAAGAAVCHVDASSGMAAWCRDNAALNKLTDKPIRYIVDDCSAFVRREIRRGVRYDAIVMDPPSFGRGRRGEIWKLEDHLWDLLNECRKLLSDQPLLFLLNCYTAHLSPVIVANMLAAILPGQPGAVTHGELGLPIQSDGKILPCGIFARWEA